MDTPEERHKEGKRESVGVVNRVCDSDGTSNDPFGHVNYASILRAKGILDLSERKASNDLTYTKTDAGKSGLGDLFFFSEERAHAHAEERDEDGLVHGQTDG